MTEALLQIKGLRAGYGGKPVLQGIDLEVAKGEIVAVIGRNGVGKSTLMKTLIGLVDSMAGTIRLDSTELTGLTPFRRARLGIGYVPQGRDVFPRMSVRENLQVGESMKGRVAPDIYEHIYQLFPILKERSKQQAGTMSGGQQQQLAIGRVLVGSPRLLLLDEPSEGIQPSIVQDIGRIIKQLNRDSGMTIMFVEQNLDMIKALAQRCYVIDKGRIVAHVTPHELEDRDTIRKYLAV
ncbi:MULTISPECIES: urea ABC transporter ATP-binding subunit UrtE [unclassified Mesorhizobium]|uniref:urea ABC transporter ATP-binding subunit UrtE n=1 Tax=unclassified Mesorhizobium TaxID=325217 RepID=UPI00112ADA6E|nr:MULTISPECIES: urea ABC transporter ATP-binding subunit UrtE [unclassified Mesorhizobium]MBZ9894485.1 urea ABC transporter ATP-binding subunit UrtE [Mesorhizobium sp. BR1-1-6]TPM57573.1 urea ABC transporter ATP-binding subunit UrtE [Mesorhizobium sp. B2-2-4]TPM65624.1 urea ABC transporter ATP-binding subunit UrtE [Mesorhizobium sp. B2-2-1]TPN38465.1 urea ABC transporter ATP-binding subunit UrtE [Mesorhizobium sp. B1-1-6]TPN71950.1 urea ABC transporter ATP-binding subunit UrtE [Mesorhizobium 